KESLGGHKRWEADQDRQPGQGCHRPEQVHHWPKQVCHRPEQVRNRSQQVRHWPKQGFVTESYRSAEATVLRSLFAFLPELPELTPEEVIHLLPDECGNAAPADENLGRAGKTVFKSSAGVGNRDLGHIVEGCLEALVFLLVEKSF